MSIDSGIFPNILKEAQVTPLFKKNDPFLKSNYRPVSILPIDLQKNNMFDHLLCAFRKEHGCQTTLLRLLEDWKQALDCNEYISAILMDLSKAFDCLPHDILICKLSAYGLSDNATKVLLSYLFNKKQQIKIGNIVSTLADIQKCVPHSSMLEPLLFNAFINDIFYFIKHCDIYNYADDNTLSFHSPNFDKVVNVLQQESNILINWFHFNYMQANPEKFQAIAVGKKSFDKSPIFSVWNCNSNMTAYISSTSICRYISTFSTCALKLSIGNKKT
jgi:hypothetical protein